jgi:cysteine desulfurase
VATAERRYLDFNATAPLRDIARAAMLSAWEQPCNPSSVHAEGRRARAILEAAREDVAALVGARPDCVVFTSGATEALNMAIGPVWSRDGAVLPIERAFASATEHTAVLSGGRLGADRLVTVPVDGDGRLDLATVGASMRMPAGASWLAVVQAANNETGVIQDVGPIFSMAKARGAITLCDAVQVVGRMPVDIGALQADALVYTSHKIGGPAGIGALVLADPELRPAALLRGGGQERGRRAGTENVVAAAGFAAAARACRQELAELSARLKRLTGETEAMLRRIAPDLVVFGANAPRLPNTVCLAVPGIAAENLLLALDLAGIAVSAGSACASGKLSRSPVLAAMGIDPDLARGAIRVSFGWSSEATDVNSLGEAFANALKTLSQRGGRRAA